MMSVSRIKVAHPVAMRELLSLSSTGNIMLGKLAHVNELRRMIVHRLVDRRFSDAVLHIRLLDEQLLHFQMQELAQIRTSLSVVAWFTETEPVYLPMAGNTVIVSQDAPVAGENFLILHSPAYSRALVWWDQPFPIPDHENHVIGMLMTEQNDIRIGLDKINHVLNGRRDDA